MKDNPLLSYLRHYITGIVIIFVEKYKLPVEGAEDMANFVAVSLVGTLTWLAVKYGPKLKAYLPLILVSLFIGWSMPSCIAMVDEHGNLDIEVDPVAASRAVSNATGLPIKTSGVEVAPQK
jgi:uncharacterized membrane protein